VVKIGAEDVENDTVPRAHEDTYAAAVARALPAVAASLAVVALVFVVEPVLALSGQSRTLMVALGAGSSVVLGALALVSWRRPLPDGMAHPATAVALALLVGDAVTYLVVAEEPRQTSTVLLLVAASGVLLVSLRWLVATLYLAWGAWVVGVSLIGPGPGWLHYATGMVLATVLALVANLVVRRAVGELAAIRSESDAAAVRDALTGIANRRGLAMVGAQIVELARRQGDAVHCIFVDIDDLKSVNDSLGLAAGDTVLVSVAEAMRSVTRSTDVVARWGGDEFCLVGPGPGMSPLELERRIRESVQLDPPVPESTWSPRVSAGGAMLAPWDSGTLDTLLGKADQEMHLRRSLRREGPSPAPRRASAE
jgi:diguanylate cyclase (GGDEF)-like protein